MHAKMLKRVDNRWVRPSEASKSGNEEEAKTKELYRKVRSILNKLTPQKFQTLTRQISELEIDTPERLEGAVDLIFEKAIHEANFSVAYANMCKCLLNKKVVVEKEGVKKDVSFRKILLNKCQKEFEREKSVEKTIHEKLEDLTKQGLSEEELQNRKRDLQDEEHQQKQRNLGNIRFIGELFKLKMLTESIMHDCVVKLLKNNDEESFECLCTLLVTIGKDLDHEKAKPRVDQYFKQINKIISARITSSLVRFMMQDIVDLRSNGWVPRREDNNPKTIDQIHREAADQAKKTQMAIQIARQDKRLQQRGNTGGRDSPRPGAIPQADESWTTVGRGPWNVSGDPRKIQNIIRNPGLGTCNGTFRGKQYFTCEPGSAVFVGLNKVMPMPMDDAKYKSVSKSPERDEHGQANLKSKLSDAYFPSFLKGKNESKSLQARTVDFLKIDQRVVTFLKDNDTPIRGTVRFIGEEKDASGRVLVGLELDERIGSGTGEWKGRQFFVCRKGYAAFVDIETVMHERDFDNDPGEATTRTLSQKQDKQCSDSPTQAKRQVEEVFTRPLTSYLNDKTSDFREEIALQEPQDKELQKENLEGQLVVLQQQLREKEQCLANYRAQLEERNLTETNLIQQLQEKELQQENSQRQLQEMEEQIREKDDDKANLEKQLEVLQQQLRENEQCLANYRAQLEERNLRETSLIQQLQEKELQGENSQRLLQEMEEQIREKEDDRANSERQLREMVQSFEERIRGKEERETNLETQLGMKNQELREIETSLSAAQQMIIELRRQESCDWAISRDEIQVKDKHLGKGAWGSVNEATYCGCIVAVKQIHELILSAHNRRLFEREMNIASRCRHPCLLQFIGATNDEGSPLFVTELMELSLRALLEQRQLTETEISVISLDVSRALNYLHHMKPSAIVHRDVSSANVLLWRQGEQWRGKVSDYGTAKFVQQTMTVAPGASTYSAPEAVSSNQTCKVDVYSFGVLLCEMCIREMPDPERREEQVLVVKNRNFRNLVRQCLQADPAMRPDMAQIIQELEQV